ncbi:hypothetical protein [Flavobacterium sp.]|uniref:hypothetical protein n=1 Tax=Flavobacterium sp. TaxID=239 RepID=UPI0031DA255E
MKKKILSLIILVSGLSCYAQNDYTKLEKDKCKVDHKCLTEYKYDSFEDIYTYNVGPEENILSKDGLTYTIRKSIFKKTNQFITTLTLIGNRKGCRTKDSYVHIQFKNGEKLKLPTSSSSIKCGISIIPVDITKYVDVFEKDAMEKIRIYIDTYEDFDITEKGQEKFVKNLQCISSL